MNNGFMIHVLTFFIGMLMLIKTSVQSINGTLNLFQDHS